MSAFVEKKTGFDGSRTLIQGGFCAWCNAGSIFAQDMDQVTTLGKLQKLNHSVAALSERRAKSAVGDRRYSLVRPESAAERVNSSADSSPPPAGMPRAMRESVMGLLFKSSTT